VLFVSIGDEVAELVFQGVLMVVLEGCSGDVGYA
jgi:hypothetical protein